MMKTRWIVLAATIGSSALAVACSGGDEPAPSGSSQAALQVCALDGAACVDVPDVNVPPLPFDGGWPFGDSAFPWPDGGAPFTFDAGSGNCDPTNPAYAAEYAQAAQSGTATPCGSCAATDCWYLGLSCVPQ